MDRLLALDELTDADIRRLLDLATDSQLKRVGRNLVGKVLGVLLMEPSTYVQASLEAAMSQLGGGSFVAPYGNAPAELSSSERSIDGIGEMATTLAACSDALGVLTVAGGYDLGEDMEEHHLHSVCRATDKPVINLGSPIHQPCQALADWKTLEDTGFGASRRKFVLAWSHCPDALPLTSAASTLYMAARMGFDVTVLRPGPYRLPFAVMERATSIAEQTGGSVAESADRVESMVEAEMLYVQSWKSTQAYGQAVREMSLRVEYGGWRVGEEWFEGAQPGAKLMHRVSTAGQAGFSDDVHRGDRGLWKLQVENLHHVHKAVLLDLLG